MSEGNENRISYGLMFDDHECNPNPDKLSYDQVIGNLMLAQDGQDEGEKVIDQSGEVNENDVATEKGAETQVRSLNALEQMLASLRHCGSNEFCFTNSQTRSEALTRNGHHNATAVDAESQATINEEGRTGEGELVPSLHPFLRCFQKGDNSRDEKKQFDWRVDQNEIGDQRITSVELHPLMHAKDETFEAAGIRIQGRDRVIHDEWNSYEAEIELERLALSAHVGTVSSLFLFSGSLFTT